MAFASAVIDVVTMPDGHTVTIHKLSGKDYEAAQFEHMVGVATGRGRNWAQRFVRLASQGTATDADAQRVLNDPLSGFDRLSLVKAGVSAWSYLVSDQPKPVTAAAIEDFDDESLELLATQVLRLTKPALFQTLADREAAQKNG
jgi:hypothetical protein